MVDQTRASFRRAILRCRRKKKKSNQSTERGQGETRVTREQEVPAYYGLVFAAERGKGRKALSCSRPRNNVSGLWFFIRARSHNGGSQSDSSTERSSLHERDDGRKARRRRARRKGGFCSHLERASTRPATFSRFSSSPSFSLSRPFSLFHLPHLSLLPRPRPTLRYPLPRLMPFVSRKRD